MLIVGLTSLPYKVIRATLLFTDITILALALFIANAFMLGANVSTWSAPAFWVYPIMLVAGGGLVFCLRLNRIKLVMLNSSDILSIARASFAVSLIVLGRHLCSKGRTLWKRP